MKEKNDIVELICAILITPFILGSLLIFGVIRIVDIGFDKWVGVIEKVRGKNERT